MITFQNRIQKYEVLGRFNSFTYFIPHINSKVDSIIFAAGNEFKNIFKMAERNGESTSRKHRSILLKNNDTDLKKMAEQIAFCIHPTFHFSFCDGIFCREIILDRRGENQVWWTWRCMA